MDEDAAIAGAWPRGTGEMARRIREHDWAATPLGPIAQWPQSRRTAIETMLACGHAMQIALGPERTVLYNDGYAPMLGHRHPSALGSALAEAWPEIWEEIAPLVDRVFAGETVRCEEMPLVMTRRGYPEETWWDFSYSPLRDERGAVVGLLNVTVDATARKRAERAERERDAALARLREREARYRALALAGSYSTYRMSADWRHMIELTSDDFLADTTEPTQDWWDTYNLEEDRPTIRSAIDAAIRARTTFELEHRVRRRDGSIGWTRSRAVPILAEDGTVVEWLGAATDITEKKRIEAALRESEEKFRRLFDSIEEGLAISEIVYDDAGEIVDMIYRQVNRAFERQGGVQGVVDRSIFDVLPGVEDHWLELYERVARTGEPARAENHQRDVDRWFEVEFLPVDRGGRFVATIFKDITARKRADAALRESERRQRFLLRFSDALRAEPDADAVAERALAMLREELRLDRAYITIYRLDEGRADVTHQLGDASVPPLPEAFRLSDFPEAFRATHDRTLVIEDELERQGLSPAERRNSGALGMRAMVAATLREGANRPLWSMVAMSARPRRWTQGEIALVEDVTERTWAAMERARADEALRESEERLRQFGEASSDVLWIRDVQRLDWEYLSPAFETIYGIDRASALAGDGLSNWLDLIVPEDREHAAAQIERVRQGALAAFEYRIRRPADGELRWLRNTDFPMVGPSGRVQRIGGIGRDITEEKRAADRLQVLLAELQHRTRNLLVVIRSVASRTLATASSLDDFAERFGDRLKALARVNGLLSRLDEGDRIAFDELIATELSGHGLPGDDGHGPQVALDGPQGIRLRSATVQTFALALHELTTNALKHGALSRPEGRLRVAWAMVEVDGEPHLQVEWHESGVPVAEAGEGEGKVPTPVGSGYGRELIERALPYQLKARTRYELGPDGLRCVIVLPVSARSSGEGGQGEGSG